MGRIRKFISQEMSLTLYKSILVPIFYYGDIIYQHTSEENLLRIQILQNCCCRIILKAPPLTHTVEMHVKLSLQTLAERRTYHCAVMMYKLIKGDSVCPLYENMFCKLEMQHGLATRAQERDDLIVNRVRTRFGEKQIEIFGARLWNTLPHDLRSCANLDLFKKYYWTYYGKLEKKRPP